MHPVMGATDRVRTRDHELVHAHHHHRRIEGEDTSLDVMTVIVGGDLGGEVHQGGIHIGPTRALALAPPFVGGIVYRRGDARLAMSVVGLDMGEGVGALGPGVTQCARVGHDRDLLLGLVRARDRIPLIQGIAVGAGRGQLAAAEGALVISEIADRGLPHDCDLLSWLMKVFCNVTNGIYYPSEPLEKYDTY